MTTYTITTDRRTLEFAGHKLANSTSKSNDSDRWIEFSLYKTESGTYVLHRVGMSRIYHSVTCSLVSKYGLREEEVVNLLPSHTPCSLCAPSYNDPIVFPEKQRHWTLVSPDAKAVVDALYKYDSSGAKYLTSVAGRLLERASRDDPELDAAYRIEVIP